MKPDFSNIELRALGYTLKMEFADEVSLPPIPDALQKKIADDVQKQFAKDVIRTFSKEELNNLPRSLTKAAVDVGLGSDYTEYYTLKFDPAEYAKELLYSKKLKFAELYQGNFTTSTSKEMSRGTGRKLVYKDGTYLIVNALNSYDLERSGWVTIRDVGQAEICPACNGRGHDDNSDLCWHCEGACLDPTVQE